MDGGSLALFGRFYFNFNFTLITLTNKVIILCYFALYYSRWQTVQLKLCLLFLLSSWFQRTKQDVVAAKKTKIG
jgi:hypothetical protein